MSSPRSRQARWLASVAVLFVVAIAIRLFLPRGAAPAESTVEKERPSLSPHSPTDLRAKEDSNKDSSAPQRDAAAAAEPRQPTKEFFASLRATREIDSEGQSTRDKWLPKLLQEPGVQSFHQGPEKIHFLPQLRAVPAPRRLGQQPGELFREGGFAYLRGEPQESSAVVFNESTGKLGVLTGIVTVTSADPAVLQASLNLLQANGVRITVAKEMPEQHLTILRHEGKPDELIQSMQVMRARGLFQTKLEILSYFAGAN